MSFGAIRSVRDTFEPSSGRYYRTNGDLWSATSIEAIRSVRETFGPSTKKTVNESMKQRSGSLHHA
jgi:hypothetical protein